MACERCGTCSRWMWVCEDRFGDMLLEMMEEARADD